MFITTKSDSIVPIGNIKAIKPHKDGSVIYLKTGEQIKDPRKHTEVLTEAYQERVELAPLIAAITTMASCIESHQKQVSKDLANLNSKVVAATSRVEESSKELVQATVETNHCVTKAKKATSTMTFLTETLNAAIQEI